MDRRAFLVGLLLEEYRRIWIDHEAERLGLECEVGDSSLIDLAVSYGGEGATADILEQLGDIFVVMCEALIAEEVPIHVVKQRVEEYVQEELFKDSAQN